MLGSPDDTQGDCPIIINLFVASEFVKGLPSALLAVALKGVIIARIEEGLISIATSSMAEFVECSLCNLKDINKYLIFNNLIAPTL